jgi:serine/threonine protein phosphatase PrpC
MQQALFKCAGDSHPGLARENNEDRFHCDPQRGIFIVVDGVGGQAAGEKAAEIAVNKLKTRLERPTGTVIERIREAITIANNEIHHQAQQQPEWAGMACVLTAAIVEGARVTIGHVGDTRLYKLQPGRIQKMTHDHSPVGLREERCGLTEIEAMRHPRRNEVFREVGADPHAPEDEDFIEIIETEFEPDSALLLCSDGLSDLVTSAQIQRLVEENAGDPKLAVQRLIEAANAAGGKDNITVILVENELFAAEVREQKRKIVKRKPTSVISLKSNPVAIEPMPLWREILNSRVTAFALGTVFGIVLLGLWQFLLWPRLIK